MKYRKLPVEVEAFQMTKERRQNNYDWPEWLNRAWQLDHEAAGALFPKDFPDSDGTDLLCIYTLEGIQLVAFDDFIIQGLKGELYACKPDIFNLSFEPV